ncbi:MAG TPA: POTRA domain-containing protein [Terriglobales bacterium]|nr:POTRA domain-containing protein [Terriglobales bacterium]
MSLRTTYLSRCTAVVAMFLVLSGILPAQQGVPSSEPAKTAPQVKQVLPSYEGQNVSSVEIAGRPDINVDELKSLLVQQPGQPFTRAKVDASIAALKATKRFKDVQLQIVPDLQGIRLLLVIQPGLYFGMYRFPGAIKRFNYSRLLQVANYPPEGPYSIADVNNATRALTEYFQKSGYFQAQVRPEIDSDPKHGLVNVIFHTTLGKRADFGEIKIEGATPEMSRFLQGKLTSIVARMKGAAIRPGKKYSLRTIENATRRLENTLLSEHRLSATVKLLGADYDPATNRADIAFHVEPGPEINVDIQGAHVWSWTKKKLIPVYQQVGTDPEILQEGRRNLISHFQSKGYFNVQVSVKTEQKKNGEQIVYQVTKGPRHRVSEVDVEGNHALREEELEPVVKVQEGRWILNRGNYSEKLVRQSVKNLEQVYKAAGFSTVQITPEIKQREGDIYAIFRVNEGPRDIVESLRVEGNKTLPVSQLAPKGLKVVEGQPYSQKLSDQDRTQIMARYLNEGYLTATFRQTVKPVDKDPHRLAVTYQIYEGPRVTANSIITIGREDTRQSFIDRVAQLRPNRPLTESDMLTSESRLYEPGIFDWAEVDPRRQITTQSHEDVVVKVHEAKPNSITYGFGFEVINRGGSVPSGTVAVPGIPPVGLSKDFTTNEKRFWGPRGNVEYTRRNVRGKAETISISGLAGRLDQRGIFSYLNPHFRSTNWASTFTISGAHDATNPIFTSRFAESGFQIQRYLDPKKSQNFTIRYSYRQTGLTRLLIKELVPQEDQHLRLSSLTATFTRDSRDSILDAHRGLYESFELGVTPSALGSSVTFARLLAQTAYYHRLPKEIIWANSIRLGFLKPFAGSHVPLSEQFFSGGGSTLRGFALNGAGPQRTISVCNNPADISTCAPTSVPAGGNQLFILNSEFRIPVPIKKGLGVVAFYDGGNVFRTIGFNGQYTNTLGFGIRYATPVGPVRFDIGRNLNAPPGIKATQYFITLGQAF